MVAMSRYRILRLRSEVSRWTLRPVDPRRAAEDAEFDLLDRERPPGVFLDSYPGRLGWMKESWKRVLEAPSKLLQAYFEREVEVKLSLACVGRNHVGDRDLTYEGNGYRDALVDLWCPQMGLRLSLPEPMGAAVVVVSIS